MTLELQATPPEVMRAVKALQQFARARQIVEKAIFGLVGRVWQQHRHHTLKRDAR